MNQKEKRVAIVGAGLAGLSAAYEISKDPSVQVEIFEKNARVGGRVSSLPVRDVQVDFGGFIVYPWYEEFHRILRELHIQDHIQAIPLKNIYYDIDGDHQYRTQKEIDFPVSDTLRLYPRLALKVLSQDDMAQPNVHQFGDQTIAQHFRHLLGVNYETLYERFTDIVCQGYCYGPVDRYKMAFVAPIIRFQRLYGDISTAFYFPDGANTFIQALEHHVKAAGGVIHTSAPVTKVAGTTVHTTNNVHSFDEIVFALPANDPLYTQLIPDESIGCSYTHFYTVAVETDSIPLVNGKEDWGAVFYRSERDMPYQILSSINLSALYDERLRGCVNMNIVVRDEIKNEGALTKEQIFERIAPSLSMLFPQVTWKGVIQMSHWTATMPIAQEIFVERVREAQAKNGWYFAGDYLGSPSMETALLTGIRAAHFVLGIDPPTQIQRLQKEAARFRKRVRTIIS